MDLDPAAAAAGVRLVAHDTVGSTNVEALGLARGGEIGPLWITAGRQTAGRGRRGRAFVSDEGNLFASLLMTDPSPPERAAELSFVAALALHDAVADLAPVLAPRLALKWPNDVLCDGAKFCGILVEGESGAGRPLVTVVGIGVNCAHHPEGMPYPATDLASCGAAMVPPTLFRVLSRTMLRRLSEWSRGKNFAAIRAGWLARAVGLGDLVRITLGGREIEGRFETLDAAGRLVLRLDGGGSELVTAGDMFPISPAASHRAAGRQSEPLGTSGEPA
jgi:BirA family transcriptional regulator, biotin operon repressor / biotin---[acetyl-CoA-carboxylase] ligase